MRQTTRTAKLHPPQHPRLIDWDNVHRKRTLFMSDGAILPTQVQKYVRPSVKASKVALYHQVQLHSSYSGLRGSLEFLRKPVILRFHYGSCTDCPIIVRQKRICRIRHSHDQTPTPLMILAPMTSPRLLIVSFVVVGSPTGMFITSQNHRRSMNTNDLYPLRLTSRHSFHSVSLISTINNKPPSYRRIHSSTL